MIAPMVIILMIFGSTIVVIACGRGFLAKMARLVAVCVAILAKPFLYIMSFLFWL